MRRTWKILIALALVVGLLPGMGMTEEAEIPSLKDALASASKEGDYYTIAAGTYEVKNDFTYSHPLMLNTEVTISIPSGKTLTFGANSFDCIQIYIYPKK